MRKLFISWSLGDVASRAQRSSGSASASSPRSRKNRDANVAMWIA
jgi:hypothetical protein